MKGHEVAFPKAFNVLEIAYPKEAFKVFTAPTRSTGSKS